MFEYSWDLLCDDLWAVLIRVFCFWGGFGLVSAHYVTEAPVAVLAALVEKSLIRMDHAGRYDMHELLRQYALEKLTDSGQKVQIKNRHLEFYCQFVEDSEQKLLGTGQLMALKQL